ncbi:NADPH-dependent F420 reductase [Sphingobacterium corticibacter]|uniref:NADP oxidoreductase coenzyme F420-dependent n=1 Tax=Sphingobacterium corticibacter TaxID=2171749 RepID=A0A2T8HN93_9SPHI|nr:NAD(P)-binding domain-containing protein [Sphingobacterium corticibacter]PVH26880.1 NADP oxidoreductase coenzyme F420-dependent [Sphingobacterium corticibacter]
MSNTKKIAIIGLGNIGKAVAENLVKGNRPVVLASRKLEDATALAQQLGTLATSAEVSDAIKEADIIVLAVWFNTIQEFFSQYASEFQGKIIIDPSNPIAPDENGGFKKIIGEKESAGQLNAAILPEGTKLAKALGTLGAASLAGAAFQKPEEAVLFYATDDTSINTDVEQLIHDSGFEPVRVGELDQSIRIEVFGDLHEFGALGKPVTLAEAKAKL